MGSGASLAAFHMCGPLSPSEALSRSTVPGAPAPIKTVVRANCRVPGKNGGRASQEARFVPRSANGETNTSNGGGSTYN